MAAAALRLDAWRDRLNIPNYQIADAARYAGISTQTVAAWHSPRDSRGPMLERRPQRTKLSYLELIEVAVVAACRRAGMKPQAIRDAREYMVLRFGSKHPFALHRFKIGGKDILFPADQFDGDAGKGKLITANLKGQLAWDEVIGARLKEFDYEEELAIRWHVNSKILIDPRISFGAPALKGVPTSVIKERWEAGESPEETADDFGMSKAEIEMALEFERVDLRAPRPKPWLN